MENQNIELLQNAELIIKQLSNALFESNKIVEKQKQELKTWETITNSDEWFDMSETAKILHQKEDKYKIYGRNTIFAILRDSKILRDNNEPYQAYIDRGYFKQIEVEKQFGDKIKLIAKTLIGLNGVNYIRSILDEYNTEKK